MDSGNILIWWALGVGFVALMALACAIRAISDPTRSTSGAGMSLMCAGLAGAALYTALVAVFMVHWILARK